MATIADLLVSMDVDAGAFRSAIEKLNGDMASFSARLSREARAASEAVERSAAMTQSIEDKYAALRQANGDRALANRILSLNQNYARELNLVYENEALRKEIVERYRLETAEIEAEIAERSMAAASRASGAAQTAAKGHGVHENALVSWKKEASRSRETAMFLAQSMTGIVPASSAASAGVRAFTLGIAGAGGLLIGLELLRGGLMLAKDAYDDHKKKQEEAKKAVEEHARAIRDIGRDLGDYLEGLRGVPSYVIELRKELRKFDDEAKPLKDRLVELQGVLAEGPQGALGSGKVLREIEEIEEKLSRIEERRSATRNASEIKAAAGEEKARADQLVRANQVLAEREALRFQESKQSIDSLKAAVADYQKRIATFGKGDFAQLDWEIQFGKWAEAAKKAGAEGQVLLPTLRALAADFDRMSAADKAANAVADLESELAKMQATLAGKDGGESEYEKMLARITSGDLQAKLAATPSEQQERLVEQLLAGARAHDEHARAAGRNAAAMDAFQADVAAWSSVYEQTRTGAERYADELARLDDLHAREVINQDMYNRAVGRLATEYDRGTQAAIEMSAAVISGLREMATGTGSMSERVKGFWQGMLDSFLSMLETMLKEWIAVQITMAAVSAAAAPARWSSTMPAGGTDFFGIQGFMAGGGDVRGGAAYVVGEAGPELFVPGASGKIVPNDALAAAGGGAVEVHLHVSAMDAQSFDGYLGQNAGVLAGHVSKLMYEGRI